MRGGSVRLGLLCAVLSCGCTEAVLEPGNVEERASSRPPLELDGVLVKAHTKAGEPLTLRARSLVQDKRRGASGAIVYHSFSELRIEDFQLGIERDRPASFSRAVQDLLAQMMALGGGSGSEVPAPERKGRGTDAPIPTRALFRGFRYCERSDAGEAELSASRARLAFDSSMLVLEGDVRLRGARGERIEARQAVLAADENGLFLPLGHRWDGRPATEAVFLVVAADGRLSASQGLPSRSYDDLLERRERVVLTHFAERAPSALRPFVSALLAQISRPAAR